MNETTRSKEQVVESILKQDFYAKDSAFYIRLHSRMMKLPRDLLNNLELVLVMRVAESNKLAVDVDRLLAKKES